METDALNPTTAARSHWDKDCPHINTNAEDGVELRWRPLIPEEDEEAKSNFPWMKVIIFLSIILIITVVLIVSLRELKN